MCVKYQCSSILKDQMFDAGLHSDVGSDQQLQSTDCWELLRDRNKASSKFVFKTRKTPPRNIKILAKAT